MLVIAGEKEKERYKKNKKWKCSSKKQGEEALIRTCIVSTGTGATC